MCRATDTVRATECSQQEQGSKDECPTPNPCSDGGTNCLCDGAVEGSYVRALAFDALALAEPFASLPPAVCELPSLLDHLTEDSHPCGLIALGDALTVRALLQNFRF
jgi:hypothetical protein